MIKTIIILILILLYLWFGMSIFYAAVEQFGGKEEYKKEMQGGVYAVALLLVVLFWPYFLIKASIGRD